MIKPWKFNKKENKESSWDCGILANNQVLSKSSRSLATTLEV